MQINYTGKKPKKVTANQKIIAATGNDITNETALDAGEINYITQLLAMVNLPYKKPETNQFQRKNGNLTVTFTNFAGGDLPYGRYPRLIIIWLITQVVIKKEREVDLGASLHQFMKEFGLSTDGRTMRNFKKQAHDLFNTIISVSRKIETETQIGYERKSINITNNEIALWDKKTNKDQIELFTLKLKLTDEFYKDIIATALPVDNRAVIALKKPFSLDLYIFLTSRVYSIKKDTYISLQQLHDQLGSSYANSKEGLSNFQRDLKKSLTEISMLWQELDYTLVSGRLLIRPCKPHVKSLKNVDN